MLTGPLVRVRVAKHRLVPYYLDARSEQWLAAADELLLAYRAAVGRTRGEVQEDIAELVDGGGPVAVVYQGLAKLLDDRCDFAVAAAVPPDKVREAVFRHAAGGRAAGPFDRAAALAAAGAELGLTADQADQALFGDLKDEQRVTGFADISPEHLLDRYNVALAQAVLLKAVGIQVRVWGETPARYRQLFRAVKFHQLICTVTPVDGNSYKLAVDGPLSLFAATQKYGLQLAKFLPTLLHCKAFELTADVRWGADKKPKGFALTAADGLRTHAPDWGTYVPKELAQFADGFRAAVRDWAISDDPHPVPADGVTWVPDFTLTHTSGAEVFVELLGYWRKVDLEAHYRRLKRAVPGRFVLVASDHLRADDAGDVGLGPEVYRFKRTPIPADVAKAAAAVAGA